MIHLVIKYLTHCLKSLNSNDRQIRYLKKNNNNKGAPLPAQTTLYFMYFEVFR